MVSPKERTSKRIDGAQPLSSTAAVLPQPGSANGTANPPYDFSNPRSRDTYTPSNVSPPKPQEANVPQYLPQAGLYEGTNFHARGISPVVEESAFQQDVVQDSAQ